MRNLTDFALRLEYERVKDLGDKLVDIGGRLKWFLAVLSGFGVRFNNIIS